MEGIRTSIPCLAARVGMNQRSQFDLSKEDVSAEKILVAARYVSLFIIADDYVQFPVEPF